VSSGEVDAAVVIHAATSVSDPPSVAAAIRRAVRTGGGRATVAGIGVRGEPTQDFRLCCRRGQGGAMDATDRTDAVPVGGDRA
jgi:hypothetical protein